MRDEYYRINNLQPIRIQVIKFMKKTKEYQEQYNFICKKFDVEIYLIDDRLTVEVNYIAPRYYHIGELLNICSSNQTAIGENILSVGSGVGYNYASKNLNKVNYTYGDVVEAFKKLTNQIGE